MTHLLLLYFLLLSGTWLLVLAPILVISLGGFLYSLMYYRFDIADVLWAAGITSGALTLFFVVQRPDFVLKLITVLILLWGTRMVYHIGSRHFSQGQEDSRYAQWRKSWKYPRLRSFFQVFLLQGLLMSIVLSPVINYVFNPGPVAVWQIVLGLWIWLLGFYFEVVGDWQLSQFLRDPKRYGLAHGDLMTKGLWAYTRHPNYFGELMMWWGIFILVAHSLSPWYILPVALGPVLLSFLLYFVSGVKKTEEHWAERYGEKFEEYRRTTPALFPRLW